MIKRIFLLLSIALFSVTFSDAQNRFFFRGKTRVNPVVYNSYVQDVIDQATIDGVTPPNSITLEGLDNFFNDSRVSVPLSEGKAEMIKFGFLYDTTLQFSRYNFVDASLYKSTFPAGKPIYGTRGWSSNGTSYIDDVITMKRRADIPTNSSSIAIMDAYNNASVDQAACGSVSGNYYIMKPYLTGGGIYYLTTTTAIAPVTTTHTVFMSLSTNGASGTRARLKQNSTYANFGSNLTGTEMTSDLPIFTCAYNNAGSPLRWYTQGNVQFRWEGKELTDAEIDGIQGAWNDYVAFISQSTWTADDYTATDGREGWCVCGDSKVGTSTAVGRYALPNTVFQRLRSGGSITEVKGADLADIPSIGSWMPYFGRLYNENSSSKGKRIVFAHYGWGGSAFLNDFKAASWDEDDTGQLYPLFKTVCDALLSTVGVTKPKGIVVILGINDMNESMSISLTEGEIDNLFNRLNTDYDYPPIYVSLPSLQTLPGDPQLSRLNSIRARIQANVSANGNIVIFQDEATQLFNTPANTTDGTHFNYTGNETAAVNLIAGLQDDYFSNVLTSQNSTAVTVDYDIIATDDNRPPEIFWAKISGDLMTDSTITALDSAFTTYGNYERDTFTYQWYWSTSLQGTGTAISGATSQNYTIDPAYDGMRVRCAVTPVQIGGANTTGTAVTTQWSDVISSVGFNPLVDISWSIAVGPDQAVNLATDLFWDNRGSASDLLQNGSDPLPTYVSADGGYVDFESGNNEELVMPNEGLSFPIDVWVRFKLESHNAAWGHLFSANSTQTLQQRTSGAMYAGGVSLGFTAPVGDWVVMHIVWSGSANTSKVYINRTEVTSTTLNLSTTAFGSSSGMVGANSAGTGNRWDGTFSHFFVKSGEVTGQDDTDMWDYFENNYPWTP